MKIYFGKKAFTLIEMSIVILVIGVVIGGVLASNALIKKFRIQTAQNLTTSSPVNGISDSVLWLESSLDKSFNSSESSDTSSLSVWYDVRESVDKNNATQSTSLNKPTYSNSINSIQAVKFDGTNGYFSFDGSVLNNTNYTIFVLENRESNKSGNYFIGDSSSGNEATTNKNLVLGYSADGTIKHSQSSDNSYTSSVTTYAASSGSSRIFTFVHDKSVGKKTYVNGLLAATSTNTSSLSGMTTLTIGKSYQGQLGEVIIFSRALTDEERQSIEDYLGKKWNSTILRSVGSSSLGGSCVGGIVSTTGCQLSCSVPSITGITTTIVAEGSSTLTCDSSNNYSGSISYTCSNGTLSTSGSCGCTAGYALSGSTCVISTCAFSGTAGITDGTSVNYGSGTQSCNVSGYSGTVNYSCSGGGGTPTINSGSCSTVCSGGTVDTTTIPGSTIHTFLTSSSFSCTSATAVQILVVGGGGGGGSSNAVNLANGGGGGGGVVTVASYTVPASTTFTVTVGASGAGGAASDGNGLGTNGGDSSFISGSISLRAYGGGGGGGAAYGNGSSGGSSGGAVCGVSALSATKGTASVHFSAVTYGNIGGTAYLCAQSNAAGGGGGGASAVGVSGASNVGGNGGAGLTSSISGTSIVYGSGGGGRGGSTTGGLGGSGAGDGSSMSGTGAASKNATNNRGGGGGAAKGVVGGNGGSGIVIIKY